MADGRLFPKLDAGEMDLLRRAGREEQLADGQPAYRAGDADVDFFVVVAGGLPC